MQTVTRETPYPSRRAFCCGLGAALALPMVDRSVLAQAPAAQEAAGPPMLPLRSPGLEHLGLTVPDPEAAAKFYGRIFGPQLFREREAPPRYYVMAGTAYLAFGGSATVTPLVDHFCALVHDYRGREMGPRLQGMGIQLAGAGMITDHDGLRLQLLGVPGGLAGTIVPGGRMSLEPPVVHAVGLDHVMLRVSDLERSAIFYRTFFGNERPRTKDKPPRVWFQIGTTRLGLEAAPAGLPSITSASPSLASIAARSRPHSNSSTSSCLRPTMRSFSASAIPMASSSNSSLHKE